jgi:competence protein ComGC
MIHAEKRIQWGRMTRMMITTWHHAVQNKAVITMNLPSLQHQIQYYRLSREIQGSSLRQSRTGGNVEFRTQEAAYAEDRHES